MNKVQLFYFIGNFVLILKNVVVYALIGRVIMSWLTMGPGRGKGPIHQFLCDATEPVIKVARKIPHRFGMMDFAPLIAMFAVDFLGQMLASAIFNLA
jgi:YggT family protein